MKKFLLTLLTVILMITFLNIDVNARTSKHYRVRSSAKHHIARNTIKTSVSSTIEPKDIIVVHEYNFTKSLVKKYNKHNGVNCSFFDPTTLKVFGVLVTEKDTKTNTIFNRPTVIITKNNEVKVVEGNLTSLENIKYAVGVGGYLTINNKVSLSNNTHFTKGFYNLEVNRTIIAITTDNKIKIMTYRNKSLFSIANMLSKEPTIKTSLFMDGGSSTQAAYANSGRKVPVHMLY